MPYLPGAHEEHNVVKPLAPTVVPPSTVVAAIEMSTTIGLSLAAPRSNATRLESVSVNAETPLLNV
jgi:hypothetical protein